MKKLPGGGGGVPEGRRGSGGAPWSGGSQTARRGELECPGGQKRRPGPGRVRRGARPCGAAVFRRFRQVSRKSDELRAARATSGQEQIKEEGARLYSPKLFAQGQSTRQLAKKNLHFSARFLSCRRASSRAGPGRRGVVCHAAAAARAVAAAADRRACNLAPRRRPLSPVAAAAAA